MLSKCLAALAVAMIAAPVFAVVVPDHSYALDGTLSDGNGGPSLTLVNGASSGPTGVSFNAGQGLSLTGSAFADSDTYSIALDFRFDSLDTKFSRIINTSSFGSGRPDDGLYIHRGDGLVVPQVDYYSVGAAHDGGPEFTVGPATSHHILFSRGVTTTSVYLDGAQVLNLGSVSSSLIGSSVLFFIDDASEETPGFVDSICTYNRALGAGDAASISGGTCLAGREISSAPEPSAWTMMIVGIGLIGAMVRRDRRAGNRVLAG